jgi:superfamily II DNA or RNA helicase
MILRDYQQELFDKIRDAINRGSRKPLVVSPTGSGKTALFCYIASKANNAGSKTLILVHRRELVSQTSETLNRFGVPHGIIQPGITPSPHCNVQLGMVQTITRRISKMQEPSLIVVDESHHVVSNTYARIIKAFPNAAVVGFTATPLRLDGKGLAGYFTEILLGPSVEWLMEQKHLCRPKYFAPPMKVSMKGIKKRGGDYAMDQAGDVMSNRVVIGDAVTHYRKLCDGARAVVFCCHIHHAETTMAQFIEAGIPSGIIHGAMKRDERKQVVADLSSGKIKIMVSVDVISEGFDLPSVEAAILLRPTTSLGLYLQQIGRILRPAQGKTAYVLDHVGNIERHGFAEDEREWTLEGVEKAKRGKQEVGTHRQCEGCYCMYERKLPACPECDWQPESVAEIKHVDGELVELARRPTQELLKEARTRADLKKIQKAKGYKAGWVFYKAKEMMLAR